MEDRDDRKNVNDINEVNDNKEEKKKLFISYSHQDDIQARGIARFLLQHGYDVWIDRSKLVLEDPWATTIDEALETADYFVALISKNSVRRNEVLREINIFLNRKEHDKNLKAIFVVMGKVHASWFPKNSKEPAEKIIEYLKTFHFLQLDARGLITISKMNDLLRALDGRMIDHRAVKYDLDDDSKEEYIFESGIPEKVYDHKTDQCFYRVQVNDLGPSTSFPFAMDNQWLSAEILAPKGSLKTDFYMHGFESELIQAHNVEFKKKNLYVSLIHNRQIILNRASLLNSQCLQGFYCDSGYEPAEKLAFSKLLSDGSIVVFLYGDNERTPSISKLPEYSTRKDAVEAWNKLCATVSMYCIRENWEVPIDKHRQEFVKQCTTLAFNTDLNDMIIECFGFDVFEKKEFLKILKDVEMNVFLQTHINGTAYRDTVKGYSRSLFYENFVVVDKSSTYPEPVLNCIFDEKKPFHKELKKLIDIYYNSIFVNFFNCIALIPNDIRPEDTLLHQLYLEHGRKEVSPDEIEYAFLSFSKMKLFWIQLRR